MSILKNYFSRITYYKCLHIPLFLDIFQFNKTLLTFSFCFVFLYVVRLKNLDWLKKQSLPLY